MDNIAILGAFFGDEGKGAVTHRLSSQFNYVAKFNGGPNAGHTVYVDGIKHVFNQIPSIDFRHPNTLGFLGSGMVINLESLRDELLNLERHYPHSSRRIIVDPDTFIICSKHIEEDKLKNGHIGTTNKGIGPAYVDKVSRTGVKIKDLLNDNSQITNSLQEMGVRFKYVMELYNELKASKVLFEGSQSVLLDLNAGAYPYVSCGDGTLAGIHSSGYSFIAPQKVYGVLKAYSTKVGAGPYPTEYFDDEAEQLRKLGKEYGAVSGRPRRVGALDLPALRYAIKRGGLTHLIVTKFDILNGSEFVKVCIEYENGDLVSGGGLATAKPIYTNVRGWQDASDPNQIKHFINLIEENVGVNVEYVSSGVGPEDFRKWC